MVLSGKDENFLQFLALLWELEPSLMTRHSSITERRKNINDDSPGSRRSVRRDAESLLIEARRKTPYYCSSLPEPKLTICTRRFFCRLSSVSLLTSG